MNLPETKKYLTRFAIPAGLILFIILIAILALFFKREPKTNQVTPSHKIIPPKEERANLPQDIKKIRQNIIAAKISEKNGDFLLFKNTAAEIKYSPSPDIFFVIIFKEPPSTYKKQAQEWFLKFGLKQTDLCNLPVRFILDFSLKKNNPSFSSLPDGC